MKWRIIMLQMALCFSLGAQRVGINIENPQKELEVRSTTDSQPGTIKLANASGTNFMELFSGGSTFPDPAIYWPGTQDLIFASDHLGFSEWMRITGLGKVGINIPNPEAKLDIKGGDWNLNAGNPGDLRIGNSNHNFRIGVATGGAGAGNTRLYSQGGFLAFGTNNVAHATITTNGNFGLGTTNPTHKLDVRGKIKIEDDATTPESGSIRYNDSTQDFEGFDGSEWKSLTAGHSMSGWGSSHAVESEMKIGTYGDASDRLGFSVAIDGVYAVVGAPFYDGQGGVYLYQNINGRWIEDRLLLASDGSSQDQFGYSVGIEGSTIIVGAPFVDHAGRTNQGAAYVFKKSGNSWTETNILRPTIYNEPYMEFGLSLDIADGIIAVGAPAEDFNGDFDRGAYYRFTPNGANYDIVRIYPADVNEYDRYGQSLSMSEFHLAISQPGYDGGTYQNQGKVSIYSYAETDSASFQTITINLNQVQIGQDVAINNEYIVIGTPYYSYTYSPVAQQGIAYVYHYENGTWVYEAGLTMNTTNPSDRMGFDVAISDDNTILVGAKQKDSAGVTNEGLCYIYKKTGGRWKNISTLSPQVSTGGEQFSAGLGISNNSIFVGSPFKDIGGHNDRGAVHIFER